MERQNLFVRHSFLKAMEAFGDAERGRLFTAMLVYSMTGTASELRGNERFIWPVAKEMIDADERSYLSVVGQRRLAGKKSAETRTVSRQRASTDADGSQPTSTSTPTPTPTPTPASTPPSATASAPKASFFLSGEREKERAFSPLPPIEPGDVC